MWKSLTAVLAGSLFILTSVLLMGLVYIFLAVGFNALAGRWPVLHEIEGVFRYLLGIPALIAVVFAGGYISAMLAGRQALLHSLAVALLASAAMLLPALENAQLTLTGMVVFSLVILAGGSGGWFWQQQSDRQT